MHVISYSTSHSNVHNTLYHVGVCEVQGGNNSKKTEVLRDFPYFLMSNSEITPQIKIWSIR